MMSELGRPRFSFWYDTGFARITEPLEYGTYHDLLDHVLETRDARNVSIRLETHENGKKWRKFKPQTMDDATMDNIVELATKTGFLYVSFYCKTFCDGIDNNEIGFELVSTLVRSTSVEIPGDDRKLYKWDGSDVKYRKLRGIYVPA